MSENIRVDVHGLAGHVRPLVDGGLAQPGEGTVNGSRRESSGPNPNMPSSLVTVAKNAPPTRADSARAGAAR